MAFEELNIDFTKQTLELCFKQNNYIIPDYQREYVWEDKNVTPLLEDIMYARNHSFEKQYFVGTIVVYRRSGEYEVIDGQQRMTTFFILICTLRKLYEEMGENSDILSNLIYSSGIDDYGNTVNSYHLELQYHDASGYLEKIFKNTATEENALTDSESRLYEAYQNIYTTIKAEYNTIDELKRFTAFVLKKVLFVQIETKDMSDALKIFETINQRGVKWAEITRALEGIEEQPLRFLRYYIMATYDTSSCKDGIIREDQIYDWLKQNNGQCHYAEQPFEFVNQMIDGVKKYVAYLKPSNDLNGNAHLKNISYFAGGKYKLHLQLMLAARKMDISALTRFKEILESVVYYATVTRTKTNTLERAFSQWCKYLPRIENVDQLNEFIEKQVIPIVDGWKTDYKGIFMSLGMDNIQQYRIRFILGRIGKYVEVQCQSQGNSEVGILDYIGKGVEIEHIMPQTCDAPERYGYDEDSYNYNKNKLGNLALLEKSINASIQNDTYENKCIDYEKSKFYLTKSIRKLENVGVNTAVNKMNDRLKCWDKWDKNSISERQGMLYDLAESIWGIRIY